MYKEIKLVLSPAEVVEVITFLGISIDNVKDNVPTEFLKEIKEKLIDQFSTQFDQEAWDQADHEFSIQAILKKAP